MYSCAVILARVEEINTAGSKMCKGMAASALSPLPGSLELHSISCLLSSNDSARLRDLMLHASASSTEKQGLRLQRQQVPACKHRFECYQTDLGLEIIQGFSMHVYN